MEAVIHETRLARFVAPQATAHPGRSGVVALLDGRDAFAARTVLADVAERTLDVQYYIWHGDMTGILLLQALRRAADRGVRVRLLIDDNNSAGVAPLLSALDLVPNVEVRLFNPFVHRQWRAVDYVTDFARLNRRMHNKSFTADGQATIIGGRNIGDEYFDAGRDLMFVDLDVLAIGPVASDVCADFERYWTSASAFPIREIIPGYASTVSFASAAARVDRVSVEAYAASVAASPFVQSVFAGTVAFEWTTVQMLSDDPAKVLGKIAGDALLWPRLRARLGTPAHEMALISPYFVPGKAGVEFFAALGRKGVRVSILTNALESTDVAAVHAGYAKRRKPLLESGATLFEMKRSASPPVVRERGKMGSSAASLHAKTFSVDRSRVFVGSVNFDPRSARLNTELGFVIESAAMASAIADAFAERIPARAYQVMLGADGALQWAERRDDGEIIHDQEPGAGFLKRAGVSMLSLLPLEWLL